MLQGTLLADKRWWSISPESQQAAQQAARQQQQQQHGPSLQQMHSHSGISSNGAAATPGASITASAELVPCMSAVLRDSGLCLQMMKVTNDMHLNVFARDTEWLDVRIGSGNAAEVRIQRKATPAADDSEDAAATAAAVAAAAAAAPTGDDKRLGAGRLNAEALGRVVRWASCGEELVSGRDPTQLSPFAAGGYSMDSELPSTAGLRRISTATQSGVPSNNRGADAARLQRQTVAGVSYSAGSMEAHCNAPAALTAAAVVLSGSQEEVADAGARLAEGIAGSKVASGDAASDADGGDQQLGSFDLFAPLLQPAGEIGQGPHMAIIKILDELPADESAHLGCKGKRTGCRAASEASRGVSGAAMTCSSGAEAAFKFYFGYLAEGTMAIEVRMHSVAIGGQSGPLPLDVGWSSLCPALAVVLQSIQASSVFCCWLQVVIAHAVSQ